MAAKIERKVNRIKLALSGLDEPPEEYALNLLTKVVNANPHQALAALKSFKVWMVSAVLPSEIEDAIQPLVDDLESILTPKPKEKKSSYIKPRSSKRAEQEKLYKALHDSFLNKNRKCARCFKRSEQVHHIRGRVGSLLTDTSNFLAVCHLCHAWIETHPREAKQLGFSASKIGIAQDAV